MHQLHKTKIAYWGHGRDLNTPKITGIKHLAEALKLWLVKRSNGFFAYTPSVKAYLVEKGVAANKVFVVNNTIDINEQRAAFDKYLPQREAWRAQHNLADKHVLLFVGRFTANKRLDFLFQVCSLLEEQRPDTHLILVGSGDLPTNVPHPQRLTRFDALTEVDALGPIYAGSDLFAYPGAVGLGPLQALCYDLPIVTLEQTRKPEFEYLTPQNSIILPKATTPAEYAAALMALFQDPARLAALRAGCWPSMRQYTIEAMAQSFIDGINTILAED